MPKLHRGFTLIELLIVMGILAVMASISIITFVGVQKKGRDGVRKADMRTIQSSLRTYYNDIGGFPTSNAGKQIMGCGSAPNCNTACTSASAWTCGTQTYMNRLPKDPLGNDYFYTQTSADDYTLEICAENTNDPIAVADATLCGAGGKKFVAIP